MRHWEGSDTWVGEGMRREVFFFASEGVELYGSLYAASPPSTDLGVVICNSWGIEADQANRLVHPLALTVAKAGGAGLVFHYPGFGDSGGDPAELTLTAMAAAAADAAREGSRRLPGTEWMPAGFMLGASAACLALEQLEPEALLLAQPALRPSEYFTALERRARRIAALTRSGEETVFGYSPSAALLSSAAAADAPVAAALAGFGGAGALVQYSAPRGTDEVPTGFERIDVDGTWRFASRDNGKLGKAAGRWLRAYMKRRA